MKTLYNYENAEEISILIKEGADVNAKDDGGWAALHEAAARGDLESAHLLIESGATVDLRDGYGRTPLHIASEMGLVEIVKFLLGVGRMLFNFYWKMELMLMLGLSEDEHLCI